MIIVTYVWVWVRDYIKIKLDGGIDDQMVRVYYTSSINFNFVVQDNQLSLQAEMDHSNCCFKYCCVLLADLVLYRCGFETTTPTQKAVPFFKSSISY